LTALAVVIVAYESAAHLPATLAALEAQLSESDELVVVDNASSDSPESVVGARGRVLRSEENLGFAGGCNLGARATSAPVLFFLNPDAVPAPECLDALRAAAASHPGWGAWQALVTMAGGHQVNTSGGQTHWLGFGWSGRVGDPAETVGPEDRAVSFASGAALCVRRGAWDAAGGFDEDYFMYGEDLDLSLRLRLAGWGVGLAAGAKAEHDYEFAKGTHKWFLLERNRWLTVLGVYPGALLALTLPALLVSELALLVVAARGGWLGAKARAQLAVLRALPAALRRRSAVQASARVGAREFAASLTADLDSPFLGSAAGIRPLAAAQAAYWRLVRGLL